VRGVGDGCKASKGCLKGEILSFVRGRMKMITDVPEATKA
jgi:hypothetical protein